MTSDAPTLTRAESVTLVVPLASGVGSIRATLRALVAVVRSVLGGFWVDTIAIEQQLPISAVERLWLLADDVLLGTSAGYADRQRLTQSDVAGRAMGIRWTDCAHNGGEWMTDLTDENGRIDWASYQELTPVAQTCLLLVAMYDGDAWRGLIVQTAQEGIDVSDRHVRRTLSELEAEGLVEASGPTKRREMYSVTEDGRKVLTGMRDGLERALG